MIDRRPTLRDTLEAERRARLLLSRMRLPSCLPTSDLAPLVELLLRVDFLAEHLGELERLREREIDPAGDTLYVLSLRLTATPPLEEPDHA